MCAQHAFFLLESTPPLAVVAGVRRRRGESEASRAASRGAPAPLHRAGRRGRAWARAERAPAAAVRAQRQKMGRKMASKRPGRLTLAWVARAVAVMMAAWMVPAGDCFVAPACRARVGHAAPARAMRCGAAAVVGLPSLRPAGARRGACYARAPPCTALGALSTPVAEQSSSEEKLRELGRLLDAQEAEITVREASGMEGDCVAQLRCSVFGQGKDMYRSQRQKMRTSPHYLLAGIYKTTLMVAVVRALTPTARQVCKEVVLADMQQLLDQAWLTEREHAQLVEQFESEWEGRSELVIGSVDCSVHEMLDSSLTLRRWVYVSSMAVRNHLRRRGIGEQLLDLGVSHARKIFGVKDMFLHVEVFVACCCFPLRAPPEASATRGLTEWRSAGTQ